MMRRVITDEHLEYFGNGLRRSAGLIGLCLAAVASGGCSTASDAAPTTGIVHQALLGVNCDFMVTASLASTSDKGFSVRVDVTNGSGTSSNGFKVLVSAGRGSLVQIDDGSFEAVEGGYMLTPGIAQLKPGKTYSFVLTFAGPYTGVQANIISNNGVNCDQTAPSLSLAASSRVFTTDGTLTLTVDASDNVAVAKVVFSQDGRELGTDSTAPYTVDVPVTSSLNGRPRFTATAYDLTGNVAARSVRVVVSIGTKFFGTAASSAQDYPQLRTYFDQLTPGNAGKWGSVEATRDQMSWTDLDTAYQFAQTHHIPFKFHTLIWKQQQPTWLSGLTPDQQLAEINQWMAAVAERYPELTQIDVVNEPLDGAPDYAAALGGAGTTGYDWVIKAFQLARGYFPNAELILNEYNTVILDSFTNNFLTVVNWLKQEGLIDGIGEQGHFLEKSDPAIVAANLSRLAATGLPIYISELDLNAANDALQANLMSRLFPVFWENTSVVGVTHWGYRQGAMWRPDAYLLRSDGTERPALTWLECYLGGGTSCEVPPYVPPQRKGELTGITLQGEDFDVAQGLLAAGNVAAYTDNGDWLSWQRVVFQNNWDTLTVAYASGASATGSITVHLGSLDSAPVATVALPPTGGWGSMKNISVPWGPITGEQNVYLVFHGGYGVANLDYVGFGAPSATSLSLLSNGDFEATGNGGWFTWASGTLATTSTRALTGTYSLALTGRTGNGPIARTLTSSVAPGKTYRASLWATIGGTVSANAHVTKKTVCKDGTTKYEWLGGEQTIADGTWVEFTGDIALPECELQEFTLYLEGPGAGVDLYLDHASVRAAATTSNVVPNSTFEYGTALWSSWNGGIVSASAARAHGGTQSLVVTNRTSNAPAATDLTSYVKPGMNYPVSIWVSIDSPDGTSQAINVTRKMVCDGVTTYSWVGSPVTVPDDGSWVEIASTLSIPDCNLTELQLYVEGGTGADLYVDDVQVIDSSLLNLIPDGTFESGQGGWFGWNNASLYVIDGYAHSGTHSLVSANRTANGSMARDLQTFVVPGKRYQATFWLSVSNLATGSADANVTKYIDGTCTSGTGYSWLGQVNVPNNEWRSISGILDLTSCTALTTVRLYAEGPTSGNLYVDDVSLVPMP